MAPQPEAAAPPSSAGAFELHLDGFTGPFDLLLSLIARRRLDITELALAEVTDEFVGYVRTRAYDLSVASEFLVIAATLLELKAARLLPGREADEPEDLELLEARDLLFARLLQYRAYKAVAGLVQQRLAVESRWYPRSVALEPHLAAMLPELVFSVGAGQLALIAAQALAPKDAPLGIDTSHVHAPAVSVHEQAALIVGRLRREGAATFRQLVADAPETLVVVGRFLALLELFREGLVAFDQAAALGELTVRWTGGPDEGLDERRIAADWDEAAGAHGASSEEPAA